MNSSTQGVQRVPLSTKTSPSISETMSSTATSAPFLQTWQILFFISPTFRTAYHKNRFKLLVINEDYFLRTALAFQERFEFVFPYFHDFGFPKRVPQIPVISIPFSHVLVPEVLSCPNGARLCVIHAFSLVNMMKITVFKLSPAFQTTLRALFPSSPAWGF